MNTQNAERQEKRSNGGPKKVIGLTSHRTAGLTWPPVLWVCVLNALLELVGSSWMIRPACCILCGSGARVFLGAHACTCVEKEFSPLPCLEGLWETWSIMFELGSRPRRITENKQSRYWTQVMSEQL